MGSGSAGLQSGDDTFSLGEPTTEFLEFVLREDLASLDRFEAFEDQTCRFRDWKLEWLRYAKRHFSDPAKVFGAGLYGRVDPTVAQFEEVVHRVEELSATLLG
jgi:hypothetical protein